MQCATQASLLGPYWRMPAPAGSGGKLGRLRTGAAAPADCLPLPAPLEVALSVCRDLELSLPFFVVGSPCVTRFARSTPPVGSPQSARPDVCSAVSVSSWQILESFAPRLKRVFALVHKNDFRGSRPSPLNACVPEASLPMQESL